VIENRLGATFGRNEVRLTTGRRLPVVGSFIGISQRYAGQGAGDLSYYGEVPHEKGTMHLLHMQMPSGGAGESGEHWQDWISFGHVGRPGQSTFWQPRSTADEPYGSEQRDPERFERDIRRIQEEAPVPSPHQRQENLEIMRGKMARHGTNILVQHDRPDQPRWYHFNIGSGRLGVEHYDLGTKTFRSDV